MRCGWNAGCRARRCRRCVSPSLVSSPSPSRSRARTSPRPLPVRRAWVVNSSQTCAASSINSTRSDPTRSGTRAGTIGHQHVEEVHRRPAERAHQGRVHRSGSGCSPRRRTACSIMPSAAELVVCARQRCGAAGRGLAQVVEEDVADLIGRGTLLVHDDAEKVVRPRPGCGSWRAPASGSSYRARASRRSRSSSRIVLTNPRTGCDCN